MDFSNKAQTCAGSWYMGCTNAPIAGTNYGCPYPGGQPICRPPMMWPWM